MNIHLNGENADVPGPLTISDLLVHLELSGKRLAVEVNGKVIPRSRHDHTALNHGDQVEVVHAIGGG